MSKKQGYDPVALLPGEGVPATTAKIRSDVENLRIVAPMAMGGGSTLYVESDGHTYAVRIPQGGVENGETFVALGRKKTPILGGWKDDFLCNCWNTPGHFCGTVWLLSPFIAAGCLMKSLKMDCCFQRPSAFPFPVVFTFIVTLSCVMTIRFLVNQKTVMDAVVAANDPYNHNTNPPPSAGDPMIHLIFAALGWYGIALMVAVRYFTRKKYQIPGNCCFDCLSVYFCSCCSMEQIYRHMRASGDEPGRPCQEDCRYTQATIVSDDHAAAEKFQDETVTVATASVLGEEDDEDALGKNVIMAMA